MSIKPDINLTVDEDIVLWHSISRGDKKAFDDFFMKYYTLLYGYGRYYVSAEDAKEVLQELMMWLWENRTTFVPDTTSSSLRQYLITSVKRRCFNILRRQEKEMLEESSWFEQEQDAFYEFIDLSVVNELHAVTGNRICSIALLFIGFNVFASGMFTALSNGIVSAILAFSRSFVFMIIAMLTLPALLGVTGVWLANPIAELAAIGLATFMLVRCRKRYGY